MACRLLRIFAFIALNLENYFTFGYSGVSLIWSRNHKNFIPVDNVATFQPEHQQDFLRKSHELGIHNFQKEVLKVAYYQLDNLVNFYDNDTKITGAYGELWDILSDYLNFTMVTIRVKDQYYGRQLPNGSYDGLVGMLTRNDVQIIPRIKYYGAEFEGVVAYTIPMHKSSDRLYIRPVSKSDTTWMLRIFSRRVWSTILVLLVFLSILSYTIERISIRVSRDKYVNHNLNDYTLYTFATFCCQGFIPDSLYRRTKILSFTKKMFASLLLMIISSNLISFMTNRESQPPFQDLDTMFNDTAYNVVVFKESAVYEQFKTVANKMGVLNRYKERVIYVDSPKILYEKGCWGTKKYAVYDSEDRQRAYGRFKCKLVATGKSYFTRWIAAAVSKKFKYKKSLDIGVLKLNEFGLVGRVIDHWMPIETKNVDASVTNSVNIEQVSMLFVILCMGMITSIVIFILENVIYLYRHHQREIRRGNFLYSEK